MLEIIQANEQYHNSAGAYLATLGTEKSVRGVTWGLRIASLILTESEDYLSVPWERVNAPEGAYLRSELMKRYKFTSANLVLSAVRGVMGQALELDLIDGNQYQKVLRALKSIKGSNGDTGRFVTTEEIAALLEQCEDTAKGTRDRALIYTAYSCGLRRSEISKIDLEHLDLQAGTLTIEGAKGNKSHVQPIGERARGYLVDYLEYRGTAPGALFCNVAKGGKVGTGISARGYAKVLETLRTQAGIPELSTHDLRRSAITHIALKTDIYTAQKFARHSNVKTTLGYLRAHNLQADLRKASDLF